MSSKKILNKQNNKDKQSKKSKSSDKVSDKVRIGTLKDKLKVSDEFYSLDKEIEEMFKL